MSGLRSFKLSLTLHFVAVAVLPLLLLGVLSAEYFENKHLDTVGQLLDAHALDVGREASEFLYDTSERMSLVEETLNSDLLETDGDINRYLQVATEGSESFESILLLDKDLRVTHIGLSAENENVEDYLGNDFSAHDIFQQHHTITEKTWSDTFLSTITVEPSVTLAVPLHNGLLLGTVSLKRLSEILNDRLQKVGQNFHFSLVDHHGIIIADSRPDITSQRINLRLHPEIRSALDHSRETSHKLHEDDSVLESVRLVTETEWAAYVSLPVDVAMQGIKPLRYILITSLSLAAILGVLLAVWLSRRMTRPILLLRDTAVDVAKGRYKKELPRVDYGELEELQNSFREMVIAVEEREESLIESQSRYRDLVNSIDGIVWELDLAEFRFTFVSDQTEHILGYPAHRWIDEKGFWQDHIHEEDRDWVVHFCGTETEASRDHDFEYRMIAKDGRTVWLKDIVSVIVEDDRPVRLSGVMFDITKRKEAELVLQETTDRLQLLIDRMPFGCIMWDADFKAQLWNPAAEKIFGFTSGEVIGKHPTSFLVPEEERSDVDDLLNRLMQGDRLAHSVNENLTKAGHRIICEWHNTPLIGADGKAHAVISMVDDVTQKTHAEEALKESESRFRTIFQTNPDAVMISRVSDGVILSVNDNLLALSGFTREEVLGNTTLGLGLWENPDDRNEYIGIIKTQGYVENFTVQMKVKSGRVRTGLISARTFVLNDELCILNVIRDITAIKQAEERMARSEARFRSLISVLGEGVIILGFNGEIVQCNQAAERILKMPANDMIGKFHSELAQDAIHEDEAPFLADEHPAEITLETGEAVLYKIMGVKQPDGEVTWLQVNTHALGLDKHGKPVAVVVSFADVTGLKMIESDLRTKEKNLQVITNQFKGVLEAIPDQIIVLDKQLDVVWLNRQIDEGLTGQVREAGIPCRKTPNILCGPASGNQKPLCDECPVKKSFANGNTEEARLETEDGRTLSLRAFPVFDEKNEVINVIEIVQDITAAIRQQAQTMRTSQLAALGELAAGVAHEINNPINGVINYAQLILNKAVAESREQELSQRIIRESERIATIVRELLYFARAESEEVNTVTVEDALAEALALVQNQIRKHGVNLEIDLGEDLSMIASRSHQIQRLFLNLITNARYALNEKYPEEHDNKLLRISAEMIDREEERFVRVVFRDHGTGIAPELLSKVLNPFVTTKPAGEGTGLGLSISHEIVQKHGGYLTIDSVQGEFTEVVVELPAAQG